MDVTLRLRLIESRIERTTLCRRWTRFCCAWSRPLSKTTTWPVSRYDIVSITVLINVFFFNIFFIISIAIIMTFRPIQGAVTELASRRDTIIAVIIIMVALCNRADHYIFALWFLSSIFLLMVALCNRADHYIFMLWFVLSFFLSFFLFYFPRLISAAADWMSAILPHMVWP